MIKATTLEFLRNLKANNEKPWFDAHRKDYEAAKKDFEGLTQSLLDGLSRIDPDVDASQLKAKDCVMRIFRDVRFSNDKTPYKSNFFAVFAKGGRKSVYAGYYCNLEPGESFFGGGIYMPMPPELAKIRQEIAYEWDEWQQILSNPSFKSAFPEGLKTTETLSRPPQGYTADHPAISFLKNKSHYSMRALTDADMCSPDLTEKLLEGYRAVRPLVAFINRGLSE
ncbi:MAG: DUF2461 domain-containing protein [Saprospiraceae bacterium]|nr:DUF2461 domain-containing protein [Saprospiraceae bacterium]